MLGKGWVSYKCVRHRDFADPPHILGYLAFAGSSVRQENRIERLIKPAWARSDSSIIAGEFILRIEFKYSRYTRALRCVRIQRRSLLL